MSATYFRVILSHFFYKKKRTRESAGECWRPVKTQAGSKNTYAHFVEAYLLKQRRAASWLLSASQWMPKSMNTISISIVVVSFFSELQRSNVEVDLMVKPPLIYSNPRPLVIQHSWCSLWCECTCHCTFRSPSPRPVMHRIAATALLEPKNHHLEHSIPCRAEWRPKIFHVQKQVVQRKARKKDPKINHLADRWSRWNRHTL